MRQLVAIALVLLGSGCQREPAKPRTVMERLEAGNLSDEDVQRITSVFPGMTKACIAKVRVGGVNAMPKKAGDCFEMTSARRWRGLWFDAFEGQQFCPAPGTTCGNDVKPKIWMSVPDRKCCTNGLYEVEFMGRRTRYPGRFGHLGMSDHEMIVDRMISIRPVPKN